MTNDVRLLQAAVREIYCDALVREWIVGLVEATRDAEGARRRVGPRHARARARRAGQGIARGSRVRPVGRRSAARAGAGPPAGLRRRSSRCDAPASRLRSSGSSPRCSSACRPPDSGSTRTEPGREHRTSIFPLVRDAGCSGSRSAPSSLRRGRGPFDIAGSRPYAPGDQSDRSTGSRRHEIRDCACQRRFVVLERYSRSRPARSSWSTAGPAWRCGDDTPWLSKPRAVAAVVELVEASARAARGLLGYVDRASAADGVGFWRAPRPVSRRRGARARAHCAVRCLGVVTRRRDRRPRRAPPRSARRQLRVPPLGLPSRRRRRRRGPPRCRAAGSWVPVVVQDPLWEQDFPPIASSCRSPGPRDRSRSPSSSRGRRSRIAAAPIASGS